LEFCTLPRTGALEVILECLGPNATVNANGAGGQNGSVKNTAKTANLLQANPDALTKIVDVTIAYPDGNPLDLLSIATGWRPPCTTHVHYRVFDIKDVSISLHQKAPKRLPSASRETPSHIGETSSHIRETSSHIGETPSHIGETPSQLFGRPSPSLRTSEKSSEVRVRKFRTLKTLRTRTQRVCLFTHLYCKEVNISQKNSEISIFFFFKILLFPL
jgi:hypothetical protein